MTIRSDALVTRPAPAVDPGTASAVASLERGRASARLLLVSDDVQLRALLGELFVAHGYDIVSLGALAAPAHRTAGGWDAAILDVSAPSCASRWLRALESPTRVPTIALASAAGRAVAESIWNRVDAVLHSPFDARKLLLIVRGLFAGRREAAAHESCTLTAGPVTLHVLLNTLVVEDREISLTGAETRILRELLVAPSTPVSRDRLTRCGTGRAWSADDRSLDTHIKRLRRKLGLDHHGRTPIRTVRGAGYLLLAQWQPTYPAALDAERKVQTTPHRPSLP